MSPCQIPGKQTRSERCSFAAAALGAGTHSAGGILGSTDGVQLSRGHFDQLAQASTTGGSFPPWLAELAAGPGVFHIGTRFHVPHEYRAAMAIRWDWLQPLITAPYMPTLGPVHPQAVTAGLFADLIEVAGTGRLLPYDKDRRWADRKDEQVLPEAIIQEPGLAMIPTLRTDRASCIRVYLYGREPQSAVDRAAEFGRRLCEQHDAGKVRLTWFLPPGSDPDPVAACTRTQLRTFTADWPATGSEASTGVVLLDEVTEAVRGTFSVFAEKLAAEGFAFLDARIRDGGTGPVLTVQRDNAIVGAIGPMEIMLDSHGAARLLPQYFGVLPEYHGLGLGRSLWRAAMHWGQQHKAAYQLLQTEVGAASDRLCQSEGLTDLGLVCTSTL